MEDSAAHDRPPKAHAKRKRWALRIAIAACAVLALAIGGFALYVSDYYHAPGTDELLSDASALSVLETDGSIAIGPSDATAREAGAETGIVLYPGAKVDPHAYVPLAEKLAWRGYLCVVVKSPFNLAFFDIDAAARIMDDYDDAVSWWVSGHSLGGVAAAQFASGHAEDVEGIVFLASYSAADLSGERLPALTLVGSEDEVVDWNALESSFANLPERYRSAIVLEGGNHAGFGSYGPQKGDGGASISSDEQQEETADAIAAFIGSDGDPTKVWSERAQTLVAQTEPSTASAENA